MERLDNLPKEWWNLEVVTSFRKEKRLNHWDELEEIRVSCSLVPEVRRVPVEETSIRDCLGPEQIHQHQKLGCASLSRKKAREGCSHSLGG